MRVGHIIGISTSTSTSTSPSTSTSSFDVDIDLGGDREPVFPRGRAHLREQGQRASDSVVCNIAEGASKRGTAAGRNSLRIALGEAGECCAVLDLVRLPRSVEQQQKLRRIGAMLFRLSR